MAVGAHAIQEAFSRCAQPLAENGAGENSIAASLRRAGRRVALPGRLSRRTRAVRLCIFPADRVDWAHEASPMGRGHRRRRHGYLRRRPEIRSAEQISVSYTHLTLPTIYSV